MQLNFVSKQYENDVVVNLSFSVKLDVSGIKLKSHDKIQLVKCNLQECMVIFLKKKIWDIFVIGPSMTFKCGIEFIF